MPVEKVSASKKPEKDRSPTGIGLKTKKNYHGPGENTEILDLVLADQASVFMAMTSVHISSGLVLHQMTSDHNRSELGIHDHSNEPSSSKLVPKVVPLAIKTATSRQELELLFHHLIAMLRTTGSQAVIKSPTQYHCDICQNIQSDTL
ncbi:hypothetical protein Tco_0195473 [Tanacetum coccineum]